MMRVLGGMRQQVKPDSLDWAVPRTWCITALMANVHMVQDSCAPVSLLDRSLTHRLHECCRTVLSKRLGLTLSSKLWFDM